MQLFLLIALTMLAFAGNSVLTRMALVWGDAGASSFALVRLMAGAGALLVLLALRDGRGLRPRFAFGGAASLALYVVGFSLAYRCLDAGVGALILFGGVQVTMFAGALLRGEIVTVNRYIGAGVALAGLAWIMWPAGGSAPDPIGAGVMLAAALGWGLYSLRGRSLRDPLADTAWNFIWAVPAGAALFWALPDAMTARGAALAIASGAITSGLGYALWYRLLPQITASTAALAQLTVPVMALAGGAALLGEPLTLRFALALAFVLGGVALGLRR
jgi:drug/metabolite transporter (DMT)-like permease